MVLKYDSQVEFSTCSKFITHFKIGNHTYLFSHGKDMDDMKSGLLLILIRKQSSNNRLLTTTPDPP